MLLLHNWRVSLSILGYFHCINCILMLGSLVYFFIHTFFLKYIYNLCPCVLSNISVLYWKWSLYFEEILVTVNLLRLIGRNIALCSLWYFFLNPSYTPWLWNWRSGGIQWLREVYAFILNVFFPLVIWIFP